MKNAPILFLLFVSIFVCGCTGKAITPEEYFSIGMAYFELGKYEEAELWLNRASSAKRTMVASQYNLGRLAYERKRYQEAARHFEGILKKDPDNVFALEAAAYARIRTGDFQIAEKHYSRLFILVPDSANDGYNHALVLYAMERYSDAEQILERHPIALLDNMDVILLYARCQGAQGKVEAIDNYTLWLNSNTDPKIRHEYAKILEHHELYARALEEQRKAFTELADSRNSRLQSEIRFALARVLLIADSASAEGITELQTAISDGFNDIAEVESLLSNSKISAANRERIRNIISDMKKEH